MKTKPSPDRHTFATEWDEIDHLYDKLLYWLYQRADPEKARSYAQRLEQLLPQADPRHDAIFGEECWSLVNEARGDLAKAIEHRENEIRLIHDLRRFASGKPYESIALKGYDYGDLSDRLNLLATLYHSLGNLDKAISTLQESKQICQRHGIPFDAEGILREYLDERPSKTLYLWVSENGVLSAREAPSDLVATTMPSVNVTGIEQTQETSNPTRRVPAGAMYHHAAGGSVVAIEGG
jgi:tetratricopeptide (TPR) repeat protein